MAHGGVRVNSKSGNKNVNIKKANNGFVVSSYPENFNGKEKVFIAKTSKEAKEIASKLLA